MLKVERLSHEGRGIAHYPDGKTVFVRNALPGEEVEIVVEKKHRQYDEALAVSIVNPSPDRVAQKCAVFGRCGGCTLQHLEPAAQILAKQSWLADKLFQVKVTPEAWLPPLQAKVWGYRHKARLGVRFVRKKNTLLIGFREAASNFLTEMDRCEVLHPSVGTRLSELKACFNTLSIREDIPQIEVAVDDHEQIALVIRHMKPFTPEDLEILKTLHDRFGWFLYLQPKGLDSIHAFWPEEIPSLQAMTIPFKPTDFVQVNFSLNLKMREQALALLNLKPTDTVLDLFCGLGNFTLPMALQAQHIIAVEGDPDIVERARQNAEAQGFSNIEFHTSNLFELKNKAPFDKKVDVVFLDPPRAGAEAVCREIERWNPATILYVACDPSTLVRDLSILVHEKGYRLLKVGVMDMFPHTAHVESMAFLVRA